ncbi:MAG: hypothetical protein M3332_00380 [Actinomycetota bacterium]|nr:hypothetical protein [Actinomycetota bacterium]
MGAVGGLYAGGVEELPNEFASFGAVIIKRLVGPFAGDQDAASGDAQVFGLVGLALAASRCHGVPSALGLNPVEKPHRAARGARGYAEFGVELVGVIALGMGGVFIEASGLPDTLG